MNGLALALLLLIGGQKGPPVPGDQIKPFNLKTLEGNEYIWKPGRTTILTVVAYWCSTWKDQYTRLHDASERLKGLPVDSLAVSVDGRWTELAKQGAWGKMLEDPGGTWSSGLGIDRVPYTFVVDPKGSVSFTSFGVVRTDELVQSVRDSLSGESVGGTVYLTFDDFPQKNDDDLLDALRSLKAPATFFSIGSKLEKYSEIVKRAAREGHSIEIHSWNHDAVDPELAKCKSEIKKLTGTDATLYRPPGNEDIETLDGSVKKLPTVDPYDFLRPGQKELVRRVLLAIKPGSAIHLHSGVPETVKALPEIVENLRKRGYQLAVLK